MSRKESFEKFLNELFTIDDLDAEETLTLKQLTIFPSSFISISDLTLILNKKDNADFEDLLNYLSDKGWLSKYQDNNNQGYKLHQINKEYFFAFHKPNFTDLEIPIKIHLYILWESGDIYSSLLHKHRLIYLEALYKTLKTLDITTKETFVLLNQIVNVFFHLGKLNLSLEILTMASKICQSINSIDDESLSRFHTLSGQVYLGKGDYKKSVKHSELACSLAEKCKRVSPRTLAGMYSNLGHVYNAIGDINNSLKSFRKAQKHITTEDDSPNSSYIYKGIAEAYKISGDYKKALNNFKEALNIRKKSLKINNPLIAQSYNDLAYIYVAMDQRRKALPLYIKAMMGYEATLGDEHTHTASVYNNLGELYRYVKQYNKAYPLIKKAIDIRELQEASPIDLATSYNTMGVYYIDINKYDEAINYLNKALNILNSILGPHHEKTIATKDNIEYLYSLMANNSNRATNNIKIGRSSPCSCGSGKKYKRCCGES